MDAFEMIMKDPLMALEFVTFFVTGTYLLRLVFAQRVSSSASDVWARTSPRSLRNHIELARVGSFFPDTSKRSLLYQRVRSYNELSGCGHASHTHC